MSIFTDIWRHVTFSEKNIRRYTQRAKGGQKFFSTMFDALSLRDSQYGIPAFVIETKNLSPYIFFSFSWTHEFWITNFWWSCFGRRQCGMSWSTRNMWMVIGNGKNLAGNWQQNFFPDMGRYGTMRTTGKNSGGIWLKVIEHGELCSRHVTAMCRSALYSRRIPFASWSSLRVHFAVKRVTGIWRKFFNHSSSRT